MAEVSKELAGQALDNLVTQFSSALDCLRELVQNSMDAGSPQIEVWTEFIPATADEGTIAIHVDDFGVGMDETIIDNELTRLFASSKENDLTKIGKFGIGFVSIFAMNPKAVLLHTGRGGEYWEVLFHEDRSFTKTRVDMPVEGTQITLYLAGDQSRYERLVADARTTLKGWCRHSDVEITIEDRSGESGLACAEEPEPINEPFELQGPVTVHVVEQGTEMALAYSASPSYGFYNKGLTLAQFQDRDQVPARYRNISFKIKSRYLEHTLSRETVMRDDNYEKAMNLLRAAADGPLHHQLVQAVEELAARERWTLGEFGLYNRLAEFLLYEPKELLLDLGKRKLVRLVDGRAASLAEIESAAKRDGRIYATESPSALTEALGRMDIPVLMRESGFGEGEEPSGEKEEESLNLGEDEENSDGEGEEEGKGKGKIDRAAAPEVRRATVPPLLRVAALYIAVRQGRGVFSRIRHFFAGTDPWAKTIEMITRPENVYMAVDVDDPVPAESAELIGRAAALLRRIGTPFRKLTGCVLGSPVPDPPLFLVGRSLGPLMAVPPRYIPEEERLERTEAAVNRDHPQFRLLLEVSLKRPELAAYCLAKDLLLVEDRNLEDDLRLMTAAHPEVQKRMGSAGTGLVRDNGGEAGS